MDCTCVSWKWAFCHSQSSVRDYVRQSSPNWICLTAGSVGRGRLLPVSPQSAVPDFIRPFTNTWRRTWAKTSCVEQMGFSGTYFLAVLPQARPIKQRSDFKSKDSEGLLSPFEPRCAGRNSPSVGPHQTSHVWQAQAVTTL